MYYNFKYQVEKMQKPKHPNHPNQRRYCLFEDCFHPKPHVHTCNVCGVENEHRSPDCKQKKKCPALGCIHPPDWPHVHKCDYCPDNTHSSKVPCPQKKNPLAFLVVGEVSKILHQALRKVGADEKVLAAAGKS